MTTTLPILVLAGARETPRAVRALQGHRRCVLWAEDSSPVPVAAEAVRGAPDGLRAILDVTHAFDTTTRTRWVVPGVPYARVTRTLWGPEPGDHWTSVDTVAEAVAALPKGARVFAATGQDSARALAAHDGPVFLRQLGAHDHDAPPNCTYVFGAGPFEVEGERALLSQLKIDVVLARNVGGPDSYPKLAAARSLGLPAVLLRPPPVPAGPRLVSAQEIAAWADAL